MSEIGINPAFVDQVFLASLDDLSARVNYHKSEGDADLYNALNIARILRLLIVSDPLWVTVNRLRQVVVQVPQWVMPQWPSIDPQKAIASHYDDLCPKVDPNSFWGGGRWYPYSVQDYLKRPQPGFVLNGQTVTPSEAIRLYANVLGGVHINGKINHNDHRVAMIDSFMNFGNDSAITHLLINRVGPDILRAMSPLYAVISSSK